MDAGGYRQILDDSPQPFLITCGNLMHVYRNDIMNQQAQYELSRYKARSSLPGEEVSLGFGHQILLTNKELRLLDMRVADRDRYIALELGPC